MRIHAKVPVITEDGQAHGWCRLPTGRGYVIKGVFCPLKLHPEHGYECILVKSPDTNPEAAEKQIQDIICNLPGITYPGANSCQKNG